jgi:thioesterase domain-containing protein
LRRDNVEDVFRLSPAYPGRIALFLAADRGMPGGDGALGWTALAEGGVEVYPVPGRHETLMSPPSVHHLARALDACLVAADLGAAGPVFADDPSTLSAPPGGRGEPLS